jgi:hypothetical protein
VIESPSGSDGALTLLVPLEEDSGAWVGKLVMFFMEFARVHSDPVAIGLCRHEADAPESLEPVVRAAQTLAELAVHGELVTTSDIIAASDVQGLFLSRGNGGVVSWQFSGSAN